MSAETDAAHRLCREDPTAVHKYNTASPFGFNGTGGPTDSAPCMILPSLNAAGCDYFKVNQLLTAAGVDIDEIQPSSVHHIPYPNICLIPMLCCCDLLIFVGTICLQVDILVGFRD